VRTGVLAELLKYGIAAVEIWVFLLNHGGARQTAAYVCLMTNPRNRTAGRLNRRRHDYALTSVANDVDLGGVKSHLNAGEPNREVAVVGLNLPNTLQS
jgi:hypothetical protein